MAALIIVIVLVVIIIAIVLWGVLGYNGLIRQRNLVQEAWHQIDVELKRRHDLIPNLVETVKGYASHERGTLEGVMAARSAAMSGSPTPAAAAQNENMLTQALGRLFAVAEAYPNLKANESFLALQSELSQTEDRIAAGRRYYNANVRALNTKVQSVPTNIIAGIAHITTAEYFEAEGTDRAVPEVSFSGGSAGGSSGGATDAAGGDGTPSAGAPSAAPAGDPGDPVSPPSTSYGSAP